jgi:hypothetical protein
MDHGPTNTNNGLPTQGKRGQHTLVLKGLE